MVVSLRRIAKYFGYGVLVLGSLTAATAAAENPDSFDGELVTKILASFESRGYKFLYSSRTITPGLKFNSEPISGTPIERLEVALGSLKLRLVQDSRRSYRILRSGTQRSPDKALVGRVIDAKTGDPIEGALVELGSTVAVTDLNGEFQLPRRFTDRISLAHDAYEPRQYLTPSDVPSLFELSLEPLQALEEIVVVSSRYAVRDAHTRAHVMDAELLDSLPRLGEDPIRLTNYLPGMSTIGVSAKPHIRGGLQDEVLVLFNNLELLEPFHLRDFQSVFSSFNPSVVDSIDVYTGGFPARYGGRMSGVMDITTDIAPTDARGEVSVSVLNTSVLFRGGSERSQWVGSARRGNLDYVAQRVNSSVGKPSYSDAYAQWLFELNEDTELDFGVIAYNDDIELRDFDEDGEIASSRYRNFYGWGQWHQRWSQNLDSATLLYFGDVRHDREGFLIDEDLDNGRADVTDERQFSIVSLRHRTRHQLSAAMTTEYGVELTHYDGSYDYTGVINRGVLADILGTQINELREYRLRPKGHSVGLFASVRVNPLNDLWLEGGWRWDRQSYGLSSSDDQTSLRTSARWKVSPDTEVRLSLGRFYQPEGIHELQIGDGQTRFQPTQYSDQAILSWYQRLPKGFSIRAEGFYKRIENPKLRFENLFNPLVLLPELASDRVAINPSEARARGYELTLRYDAGTSAKGWLSYSRLHAEDRVGGDWQARVWDHEHSVTAGFSYKTNRWKLDASLIWHNGWRTTDIARFVEEGEPFAYRRNRGRLRDYLSLDVQVSRTWQWDSHSLTAFLELTNLLSRRNVGGIEFDVEDMDNGTYELIPAGETLLPLVPSIGVRWNF